MNLQKEYVIILVVNVTLLVSFSVLLLKFFIEGNYTGSFVLMLLIFLSYRSSVMIYQQSTAYKIYFYPLIVCLCVFLFGGLFIRTSYPILSFPALAITFGIFMLLWVSVKYNKILDNK